MKKNKVYLDEVMSSYIKLFELLRETPKWQFIQRIRIKKRMKHLQNIIDTKYGA